VASIISYNRVQEKHLVYRLNVCASDVFFMTPSIYCWSFTTEGLMMLLRWTCLNYLQLSTT